jgi:[NiFe] hydrogenase assembly HybE family chaperone
MRLRDRSTAHSSAVHWADDGPPVERYADAATADIEQRLQEAFERIHQQRMLGLPILHPGLRVAVVGGRRLLSDSQADWLGILLTPWCMNLVLIPGPESTRQLGSVGSTRCVDLPAGRFELITSEEASVGRFAACSLFSPMHDFADQASALAMAEAIMTELFEPQGPVRAGGVGQPVEQHRPQRIPPLEGSDTPRLRSTVSRRDLLCGRICGRR